jgi:hypothetical protein
MKRAKKQAAGSGGQYNTAHHGSVYATMDGPIHVHGQPQPTPTAPPAARERVRILLLAANPLDTFRLALDEEVRQITERLQLSRDGTEFELVTCFAVRPADLLQHLNQHRPHIVHFSGHGMPGGEILLSGGDGYGRQVCADALADLFRAVGGIRVVVLNACHSAAAEAIGRHVDYLVGMSAPVSDLGAAVFAAGFYSALGHGRTVPEAFDQAVAMLGVHGLADRDLPKLVARPNADPFLR